MITVVVDRESVAAGDDANPHAVDWPFDDDARLGDVVLRIIDERFLPSMNDVTWTLTLVGQSGAVQRNPDGSAYYVTAVDPNGDFGVLLTDDRATYRFAAVRRSWTVRTRLRDITTKAGTGELVVFATYGSGGRTMDLEDLRAVVAETDEAEQARWAEYRHRTWPQFFDEQGNRRES